MHGDMATTEESKRIDKDLREISKEIFKELKKQYPELSVKSKLDKDEIPGNVILAENGKQGYGACQPDGQAWFYKGQLIATFEAKHQGPGGNAIERFFKNFCIVDFARRDPETSNLKAQNCSIVLFASGEGVLEGGPIHDTLYFIFNGVYGSTNEYSPGKNTAYYSVNGFTQEEVKERMRNIILERISYIDQEK